MQTDSDPEVRSRTMVIGTVFATVALLLLGIPWPIAVLAGLGGFVVSRVVGRRITPGGDDDPGPASHGDQDEEGDQDQDEDEDDRTTADDDVETDLTDDAGDETHRP